MESVHSKIHERQQPLPHHKKLFNEINDKLKELQVEATYSKNETDFLKALSGFAAMAIDHAVMMTDTEKIEDLLLRERLYSEVIKNAILAALSNHDSPEIALTVDQPKEAPTQ